MQGGANRVMNLINMRVCLCVHRCVDPQGLIWHVSVFLKNHVYACAALPMCKAFTRAQVLFRGSVSDTLENAYLPCSVEKSVCVLLQAYG